MTTYNEEFVVPELTENEEAMNADIFDGLTDLMEGSNGDMLTKVFGLGVVFAVIWLFSVIIKWRKEKSRHKEIIGAVRGSEKKLDEHIVKVEDRFAAFARDQELERKELKATVNSNDRRLSALENQVTLVHNSVLTGLIGKISGKQFPVEEMPEEEDEGEETQLIEPLEIPEYPDSLALGDHRAMRAPTDLEDEEDFIEDEDKPDWLQEFLSAADEDTVIDPVEEDEDEDYEPLMESNFTVNVHADALRATLHTSVLKVVRVPNFRGYLFNVKLPGWDSFVDVYLDDYTFIVDEYSVSHREDDEEVYALLLQRAKDGWFGTPLPSIDLTEMSDWMQDEILQVYGQ